MNIVELFYHMVNVVLIVFYKNLTYKSCYGDIAIYFKCVIEVLIKNKNKNIHLFSKCYIV